ncbi:MAG: MFS transporter [Phycisphaerae bacterium]|nr:MFS transporter [Phycisphaerae bacterium]
MTTTPAPSPVNRQTGPKTMVRALRNRNYRLFFFGQGASLVGTWMQRVALAWLVYGLTDSEWMLGVVGFAGMICTFLLAPVAGVLADRVNRRGLIVGTQALAMTQAFLLAGLTLSGGIAVWQIIALSAVLGLINAFDIPTRQSFVVDMLESRDDLPNAIALNSFLVNGAKLAGPALGGALVAVAGEGLCFLLNGLTFLAVIAALLAMRLQPSAIARTDGNLLTHFREGLGYAMGFGPIRLVLGLLAVISLLGMSVNVLMPVFARDILAGGPETLGWLTAATGIGAIAAALFLVSRRSVVGMGRRMAVACALMGLCLIAFAFSQQLWISLALLAGAGFGTMIQLVSANTTLQTIVDDDKRGRVMSLYTMCFMGMGPFGSLLMGALARWWGAPTAMMISGAGCILAALAFASRLPVFDRQVRPVYVRKGALADVKPATAP